MHQSSSSSSEDSEAEVRIIAKNFNISVYKFNTCPLNYPYHVCVNLCASGEENVCANRLVCSHPLGRFLGRPRTLRVNPHVVHIGCAIYIGIHKFP